MKVHPTAVAVMNGLSRVMARKSVDAGVRGELLVWTPRHAAAGARVRDVPPHAGPATIIDLSNRRALPQTPLRTQGHASR